MTVETRLHMGDTGHMDEEGFWKSYGRTIG